MFTRIPIEVTWIFLDTFFLLWPLDITHLFFLIIYALKISLSKKFNSCERRLSRYKLLTKSLILLYREYNFDLISRVDQIRVRKFNVRWISYHIVLTLKAPFQIIKCFHNNLLNLFSLFACAHWKESESLDGARYSNPDGQDIFLV